MYTTSVASKVNKRKFKRTNITIGNSNRQTPRQRSIERSKQSTESVLIYAFHSKTGREKSSSFQPKITEQLCPVGEIQTGGLGDGSHPSQTWRSYDETRFTRRVFHGTNPRGTQEIPQITVPKQNIRIPMPSVRSVIGAKSLHKVAKTGCSDVACDRDTDSDIPRRYVDHASRSTGNYQDFPPGAGIIDKPGIPNKNGEVFPVSNSNISVPWSPPGLSQDDHCGANGETPKHSTRMQQCGNANRLLDARIGCDDWQNESDGENRDPPSSAALPRLAEGINRKSTQEGTSHQISTSPGVPELASNGGATVVDITADFRTQWGIITPLTHRYDDHGGGVYQQKRGHTVCPTSITSDGDLGVLPITPDMAYSKTSPRLDEFRGGLCVQELQHTHRMDVGPQ